MIEKKKHINKITLPMERNICLGKELQIRKLRTLLLMLAARNISFTTRQLRCEFPFKTIAASLYVLCEKKLSMHMSHI